MILICFIRLKTQVWIKDPVVIIWVPMGLPKVCQTINNTIFNTTDNYKNFFVKFFNYPSYTLKKRPTARSIADSMEMLVMQVNNLAQALYFEQRLLFISTLVFFANLKTKTLNCSRLMRPLERKKLESWQLQRIGRIIFLTSKKKFQLPLWSQVLCKCLYSRVWWDSSIISLRFSHGPPSTIISNYVFANCCFWWYHLILNRGYPYILIC